MKQPVITRYTVHGDAPSRLGYDDIHIERAGQLVGPAKWAVRRMGECLNKSGEWEDEPMPSNRDKEFLARCRFDTPEQAFAALGVHVAPAARHPTLAECEAAGRGPENYPGKPYDSGGLPDTPEERARFEAYMHGHGWSIGEGYDEAQRIYPHGVRQLYGLWRDRGSLPTTFALGAREVNTDHIRITPGGPAFLRVAGASSVRSRVEGDV